VDTAPLRILCLSNMYPGPQNPDYGAFVATMCDAVERLGHEVQRVVIDTRAHGALRTPAKYATLAARAIRHTRGVDVIYAHYLFPTGAIAAAAGRLMSRPWVITAHGQDVRNLQNPRLRALTAGPVRDAAAVIAVSRFLAAELRASGLALPPVSIANMGVDVDRFQPADRAAARARLGLAAGPLVLAVGGLTERKNPLRLLQAFHHVRLAHPDARLAFVGQGPLGGAILAGAERLGIGDAVMMPGALPNTAIPDWFAACDVLALPSLVEPLGIVALEALASGRPVAVTRVGGAVEVVGRGGVTVDPTRPASIARGLLQLIAQPPPPITCRDAALAHTVDRQAARVIAVLQAAVSRRALPASP
jgi:glycosyltransferase involved in cell wall biosynthesis